MGNILDLSAYQEETADIKFASGEVLHLNKPSEALVIRLLGLKDVDEHSDPLTILRALNTVAREVLNNNADGVTFDEDTVRAMATDVKTRIISAYTDFAVRLQSNPTTSSPSSPVTSRARKRRRSLLPRFGRSSSTRD